MKLSNYEIFNIILGTDIRTIGAIKSIVNRNERTPSLKFYYNEDFGDWFFKDFSSGEHGGPVKFIMLSQNVSYEYAKQMVRDICNNYSGSKTIVPKIKKEKVYSYDILPLDDKDIEYWKQYNVSRELLVKHNVYTVINLSVNNTYFSNRWIGYFNNKGALLQVYAPKNSIYNDSDKKKFLTLKKDTIFYCDNNSDSLIITKSKKDIIVLDSIYGNRFSYVSWIGETKKLENDIKFLMLLNKYKKKYINFDNDDIGIKSMEKLKKFGLIPLIVNGYKDVSDYVASGNNIDDMFNIKL